MSRYSISFATVVMLVLLRLTIGWHFFSEGMKHYSEPNWTSEPVLRMARGPLAPLFHAYIPEFHGFDEMLRAGEESLDSDAKHGGDGKTHPLDRWTDKLAADWESYRAKFTGHFGFDETQQTQSTLALRDYEQRLRDWVAANREAVETHMHQWQRKETTRELPSGGLPYQKKRFTERTAQLNAEASGWGAELKGLEKKFESELNNLVTDEERAAHKPFPPESRRIDTVDRVMTYGILAVGMCLLLGLFTRLASVAAALFLLSVVLMQPFWVPDTVATFNQYVEMVALLVLATTAVGRWGGLDFFLAHLFWGKSEIRETASTKGQTDVSPS